MPKIDIAGLKIDAFAKPELLTLLRSCLTANRKIWLTTLYSEFLHAALRNPKIMEMLNRTDIAIPDGIGIFWAKRFLDIPLIAKNYWLKILQAYWQALRTLIVLPFDQHQTIPGSELIWDITRLAAENNLSIFLLGGFGDTPKIVADKLISQYPNILISRYSNKNPDDDSIIEDIQKVRPDILFVAYGPIKQERWIFEHRDKLPAKLLMGVGGSFDYIASKRLNPPRWMRKIGLEWLWRLFTQPHRIKRIHNATLGLILMLVRYKIFNSLSLRRNVAVVILNKNNAILTCQRKPTNFHIDIINWINSEERQNYWQFPQGGIDEKENLVEAAKREAYEETGLKKLELITVSPNTHTYIWNNALRKFWKNRFYQNRGQTQNIVYFKYSGDDNDIKVDNHEFINFRWINLNDLENTLHPERLTLTKIVQNDLKEMREKGII